MTRVFHFVFSLIILFGLGNFAVGQEPISEEKNKLIGDLVFVMKMDRQFPEMMDTMLKGMEATYPVGFNAAVDSNPGLSIEQKKALKISAGDRFVAFSQKFRKRLPEVVDYSKYIRDAIYPLYDKFYSEQELRDLIAFYKTPTGQKVIDTLPALLADSNVAAKEKLLPQLIPLIESMVREDFEQIAAPPKPKRKGN